MLEEEFVIGLEVLAHCHAGEIDFNCSSCDEHQKSALGCYEELKNPIINDLGEWYRCPLKFISARVYEWYDEYSYYDHFKCAPPYTSISNRFWEATKIYLTTYNKLIAQKHEKASAKSRETTTTNSLNALKAGYYNRNRKKQ